MVSLVGRMHSKRFPAGRIDYLTILVDELHGVAGHVGIMECIYKDCRNITRASWFRVKVSTKLTVAEFAFGHRRTVPKDHMTYASYPSRSPLDLSFFNSHHLSLCFMRHRHWYRSPVTHQGPFLETHKRGA